MINASIFYNKEPVRLWALYNVVEKEADNENVTSDFESYLLLNCCVNAAWLISARWRFFASL